MKPVTSRDRGLPWYDEFMECRLVLVHLYPDLLNLYGDRGNVLALTRRAQWAGWEVEVCEVGVGEPLDLEAADMLFVGGGQDRDQRMLAADLSCRREAIMRGVEQGLVVLAVCGGYQLLGRRYVTPEGEEVPGIGLLDLETVPGPGRLVGNVAVDVPWLGPPLVGFENHGGRTVLGPGVEPLGRVLRGQGNNGRDGTEGARQGHVYGTYLHGALLPKNPAFTDHLLTRAAVRRHGEVAWPRLEDLEEQEARRVLMARLGLSGRE